MTKFSYDAVGRPNLINYIPPGSNWMSGVYLGVNYGPLNRRSLLGFPNGVTTAYSYASTTFHPAQTGCRASIWA